MSKSYQDKGYAWVILFCATFNNFIIIGILKSMGILFIALYQTFGVERGFAALITVTCAGILHGISPISTFLLFKFGYRKLLVLGTSIASLGIFASYFAKTGTHVLITFGIIQGIGIGLATTPNMSITSQYFIKHRAKASGILYAGCSLGSSIFPIIIEYLIEEYGLRGAFLILSGICFHTIASSILLHDPPKTTFNRRNTTEDISIDRLDDKSFVTSDKPPMPNAAANQEEEIVSPSIEVQTTKALIRRTLKSGFFYLTILSALSASFALVAFHSTLPDHALTFGIDIHKAAYLITISSIADLFGRLTIGYIVDKNILEISTTYGLSLITSAIFCFAIAYSAQPSFISLSILSVFYSLGYGSSHLHFPVAVSHYLNPKMVPFVMSAFSSLAVILIFFSAKLSTQFFEMYHNYSGIFYVMSAMFITPSVIWLIFSIVNWRNSRTSRSDLSRQVT